MYRIRKNNLILFFLSLVIFFFAACYITYPLIFHLGNSTTGYGDELVIAWIQNWVQYSLTSNILAIFDANIYYPYHNTLAFSETFITTSILAIPIKIILQEPIATVNFTFLSSLVFLGASLYLLSYYLTKDFFVSLLSGFLVIFSPAVLSYSVHLQMLAVEFVPLAILFFLLFIKSQKTKYLAISLFFFLLQIYNSIMPAYFILFSYIIIIFYYWLYNKEKIKFILTRKNAFIFFITFLFIIPLALPYYKVSAEFNYVRDIRDAIHFALQIEDLFYPSENTRLSGFFYSLPFNQYAQNGEFKPGYLGLVFTCLTIGSVYIFIKTFKKKNIFLNSFITIAILGLILSLGPFLHLFRHTVHTPFPIPLPYALFYYIIPGFQGFRNSARWEMLFIICMAISITLVLHALCKRMTFSKRILFYVVLIVGCIIEFNFPIRFYKVPQTKEFPGVYAWLATTPTNTSIIEMPIYNWNMGPYTSNELFRQYYGTIHFRRTINGYSGFSPIPWQEQIYFLMESFPDKNTITRLRSLGVNYIVLHSNEYDMLHKDEFKMKGKPIGKGATIRKMLQNLADVKLIKQFGDDYVYKL